MEDMGTREEYLEVEEKGESGVVAEWGRGLSKVVDGTKTQ